MRRNPNQLLRIQRIRSNQLTIRVTCVICGYSGEVIPGSGCHSIRKVHRNYPKIWICDTHHDLRGKK